MKTLNAYRVSCYGPSTTPKGAPCIMATVTEITKGTSQNILVNRAVYDKLENVGGQKATWVVDHIFSFAIGDDGMATDVTVEESRDRKTRKKFNTAVETMNIEIMVNDKGEKKVVGIPADFDLAVADSIKKKFPTDISTLLPGSKVHNHPLLKIIDEGVHKTFVFKPVP